MKEGNGLQTPPSKIQRLLEGEVGEAVERIVRERPIQTKRYGEDTNSREQGSHPVQEIRGRKAMV